MNYISEKNFSSNYKSQSVLQQTEFKKKASSGENTDNSIKEKYQFINTESKLPLTERDGIKEVLEGRMNDDKVLREYFDYRLRGIKELGDRLTDRSSKEKMDMNKTIDNVDKEIKNMAKMRELFTKKNAQFKRRNQDFRASTITRIGELNLK